MDEGDRGLTEVAMMIPPMRQYQLSTSLNIAADVASTSCNSSKLKFPREKQN